MNIAVLHYHLQRGGVTRVIANHLLSLDHVLAEGDHCRVAVIFGGETDGWPKDLDQQLKSIDLSLHQLPSIGYDDRPIDESAELTASIIQQLDAFGFSRDETVLHIHNHSLGKNASLTAAVRRLASDGWRLLLQIHDFAEDFRPNNYRLLVDTFGAEILQKTVYPQASNIHYSVLNRRDFSLLRGSGVSDDCLHWLPNPVAEVDQLPDRDLARLQLKRRIGVGEDSRYLLYPVRGIRRKNAGELVLWSAICDDKTHFAMTLPPQNPEARRYYDRWNQFINENELRCHLNTGSSGKMDFHDNLIAADLIVTTSVAEGFGMVFLESWLFGRSLFGRDLPDISVDFVDAGLRLEHLYSRFEIPIDWLDADRVISATESAFNQVLEKYGQPPRSRRAFVDWFERKSADGAFDFADLDEDAQAEVIRIVLCDQSRRANLRRLNPTLSDSLCNLENESQDIEQNRAVIGQHYSMDSIRRRLRDVYAGVVASQVSAVRDFTPQENSLVDQFLDLDRFRLIRS